MLLMAKKPARNKVERPKVDTEQINVRLSGPLLDALDRIGEPFGIRRSQLIHQAVLEFVMRHQKEGQPQSEPPRRH